MSALDKILEDDEVAQAHDHLVSECPWYKRGCDGEDVSHEEPDACQREEGGVPRLVVKLTPRTPEASTVVKPTVPPGGPGLFHVKGMHLPPYMEHLWFHLVKRYGKHDAYRVAVGIVHKWAKGINPGGWKTKSGKGKRVHADVQAAAAKNIAEWEADRARAHEQGHAADDLGQLLAFAGAANMGTVTSPSQRGFNSASSVAGKYSQYGLHQHPSQTVSPSPPLPPDAPRPTPAQVRALISRVPQCSQVGLSNSAKTFLETAAVKLEKDDEQGALAALRSAHTAVYSAHKQDLGPYMASVYNAPGSLSTTDARIIPAGQSSATAEMRQGRERQGEWKRLSVDIAVLIERLRKRFFHGHINGVLPNVRFTAEEAGMTALDKVLALAGAVVTGKDVSFPTETDTSMAANNDPQTKDSLDLADFKGKQELAALPAIVRIDFETHMRAAREAYRQRNIPLATGCLAKALGIAKMYGAHHLAKDVHRHKEVISKEANSTHSGAEDRDQPLGGSIGAEKPKTGNARLSAALR